MFQTNELQYLLNAVEKLPITNTAEGRNKAAMIMRLCEALEISAEEDMKAAEANKPKGKAKKAA